MNSTELDHRTIKNRIKSPSVVRFKDYNDIGHDYNGRDGTMSSIGMLMSSSSADSGAHSPDFNAEIQPAASKLKVIEQRIKLLDTMKDVVSERYVLESNHVILQNLQEQLTKKLNKRIDEYSKHKMNTLQLLRRSNNNLEKERNHLIEELEHLKNHLERHKSTAVQISIVTGSKDTLSMVSSIHPNIGRTFNKKGPSKQADIKLTAFRLLKDIEELRRRVQNAEYRLSNEIKRKKKIEEEISNIRKQLSIGKITVAAFRLPTRPSTNATQP